MSFPIQNTRNYIGQDTIVFPIIKSGRLSHRNLISNLLDNVKKFSPRSVDFQMIGVEDFDTIHDLVRDIHQISTSPNKVKLSLSFSVEMRQRQRQRSKQRQRRRQRQRSRQRQRKRPRQKRRKKQRQKQRSSQRQRQIHRCAVIFKLFFGVLGRGRGISIFVFYFMIQFSISFEGVHEVHPSPPPCIRPYFWPQQYREAHAYAILGETNPVCCSPSRVQS
jgi:hypothetical protein